MLIVLVDVITGITRNKQYRGLLTPGDIQAIYPFRHTSHPAVFLEGGEIYAGGRVPAVGAIASAELLGDLLIAVRNFQRRVLADIMPV